MLLNLKNLFGKKKTNDKVSEAQSAALKAMVAEQELAELVNKMSGNGLLDRHIQEGRKDIALMKARIGR